MKATKSPNKKINKKLDDICSLIVKERDHYTCIKCQTRYPKGNRALTTSHFWSRTHFGTRWDLDNLDTVCLGCHMQIEHDKQGWYMRFKKEQLGTLLYNALEKRSRILKAFSMVDKQLMLESYENLLLETKN